MADTETQAVTDDPNIVALVGTLTDVLEDYGALRRVVERHVSLLDDGIQAIQAGRYTVAEEFMERTRDALRKQL